VIYARTPISILIDWTYMKKHHLLQFAGLAFLPLAVAGLLVLVVAIQAQFRYDQNFFTARYQDLYSSPSIVAEALEKSIRTNDPPLYAELTGLRKKSRPIEHNPNIRLAILLQVDDAGYFQYLFFDVKTYARSTFYIKKVMGRWVVVPQDMYFYLDSGRWLVFFTPLALIWWGALLIGALVILIHRSAARFREGIFKGKVGG
jgi:hypothetical protein